MEEQILTAPETAEVVDIQFRAGQKVYYFDPAGHTCKAGDHVIIDTARGPEFGICTAGNHRIPMKDVVAPLRCVLRLANAEDERIVARNRAEEKRAFDICMQKIGEHGLEAADNFHCFWSAVHQIFFKSLSDGQGLGGEIHLEAEVLVGSHNRYSFLNSSSWW